jgi:hypothetical protein
MKHWIACILAHLPMTLSALDGDDSQNAFINSVELHGVLPSEKKFELRIEVLLIGLDEINARLKEFPLFGLNQLTSNSTQRVIGRFEIIVNGVSVAMPEAAVKDLFDPSFCYTLRVSSSQEGLIIAFAGGSGEREYRCKLFMQDGRCSRREIRMLDNHAQEVVYSKQF